MDEYHDNELKFLQKIFAVQRQGMVIIKGKRAPTSGGYRYADLEAVHREVLPVLWEHGLMTTAQDVTETQDLPARRIRTSIVDTETGFKDVWESVYRTSTAKGATTEPQRDGATFTYARRYALLGYFNLAPVDDDAGPVTMAPWPEFQLEARDRGWDPDQIRKWVRSKWDLDIAQFTAPRLQELYAKLEAGLIDDVAE